MDGGSTDDTINIVKGYGDKITKVISEPDQGIYDAMNKGIRLASGNAIGILNSDDVFFSTNTIKTVADIFTENPHLDGLYADLVYVKKNDINKVTRSYSSKFFSPWKIRFGLIFPHPTLYLRPSAFKKVGLYKLNYRVAADFEMMARITMKKLNIIRNPNIMVKMREGGISGTGIWWIFHQNLEIVRACKENGIYTNIIFLILKVPIKLISYLKR
ncbi:MAG: glycosyltransferase [Gammaproteobacteria bacterium]|nr:MAG: glycosyltransferase [Gammaproteobacteria bacterium]